MPESKGRFARIRSRPPDVVFWFAAAMGYC